MLDFRRTLKLGARECVKQNRTAAYEHVPPVAASSYTVAGAMRYGIGSSTTFTTSIDAIAIAATCLTTTHALPVDQDEVWQTTIDDRATLGFSIATIYDIYEVFADYTEKVRFLPHHLQKE
eukprot:12287-Heterococcus_DN1.PRE.13